MGTTRYADPAGSNTAPYDTWAKAATNPQTIIDLAVEGDTNYYRGTFTLAVPIDFDTNTGSSTGMIIHIGCNASGVDDGTRVIFDANSTAENVLKMAALIYYHHIKNFTFKNATAIGVSATGLSYYNIFENCSAENNGSHGWGTTNFRNSIFVKCKAINNGGYGFYLFTSNLCFGCVALNNSGTYGIQLNSGMLIGCVSHGHANNFSVATTQPLVNCVADGWVGGVATGNGFLVTSASGSLIGCRSTNCAIGIKTNTGLAQVNYRNCVFSGNTADTDITAGGSLYDTGGNEVAADDGYAGGQGGGGTYNYNLDATADLRRDQIDVDGTNEYYLTAGLPGPDYTMPSITGISNPCVPLAGQVGVVVKGRGFSGTTPTVKVNGSGGTACTSVVVSDDNNFTCDFPAMAAGKYTLYISSDFGTFTSDNYMVDYTASYTPPSPGDSPEAEMWDVFKTVMSWYPDLVAFVTTYVYNRAQNAFAESDSPVFKAWPYLSDVGQGADDSLTVGVQARIYKDTPDDTIEDDLMDFVNLIRAAVGEVENVDNYYAEITDEDIECVEEGSTAAEAYIEVRIWPK